MPVPSNFYLAWDSFIANTKTLSTTAQLLGQLWFKAPPPAPLVPNLPQSHTLGRFIALIPGFLGSPIQDGGRDFSVRGKEITQARDGKKVNWSNSSSVQSRKRDSFTFYDACGMNKTGRQHGARTTHLPHPGLTITLHHYYSITIPRFGAVIHFPCWPPPKLMAPLLMIAHAL